MDCGIFLAPIIMELLLHEAQFNINITLDEELGNLTRLLMIIKCEINAREKCATAMELVRVGKMFFLLRNLCHQLVYLLDKNLYHSVFSIRMLTLKTSTQNNMSE